MDRTPPAFFLFAAPARLFCAIDCGVTTPSSAGRGGSAASLPASDPFLPLTEPGSTLAASRSSTSCEMTNRSSSSHSGCWPPLCRRQRDPSQPTSKPAARARPRDKESASSKSRHSPNSPLDGLGPPFLLAQRERAVRVLLAEARLVGEVALGQVSNSNMQAIKAKQSLPPAQRPR